MKLTAVVFTSCCIIILLIFVEIIKCSINCRHSACAFSNQKCDPYSAQPCCHRRDACVKRTNTFICAEEEKFQSLCQKDENCSAIKHAECSQDGRCVCQLNYRKVSQFACAPLLGQVCVGNERCAPIFSLCIENECQCKSQFLQCNKHQCLPTVLGKPCNESSFCKGLQFSECLNNICVCTSIANAVNSTLCLPFLDAPCRNDGDCVAKNSHCIRNQCQCRPNYIYRRAKCVPKYLHGLCQINSDCREIKFAECLAGICTCRKSYVVTENATCTPLLGTYCDPNNKCTVENSECTNEKCQCKAEHKAASNNLCIKMSLGKNCQLHSDCDINKHHQCTENKICACANNYTMSINKICIPISNGFCSNNKQCLFTGFRCVDNKCQCKSGYTLRSNQQCSKNKHVPSCFDDLDCGDPWHAKCFNGKCVCTANHLAINNSTCYPILRGNCWNEHQCLTKDSECIDYHCQCKKDFVALSDNFCASKKSSEIY